MSRRNNTINTSSLLFSIKAWSHQTQLYFLYLSWLQNITSPPPPLPFPRIPDMTRGTVHNFIVPSAEHYNIASSLLLLILFLFSIKVDIFRYWQLITTVNKYPALRKYFNISHSMPAGVVCPEDWTTISSLHFFGLQFFLLLFSRFASFTTKNYPNYISYGLGWTGEI